MATLLKSAAGTAGLTFTGLSSRVDSLGISVKDDAYGAKGDGATNDTTAINAAITAASALGSLTKRIRVRFPDGVYMTDGILAKPNVWLDFGNAYIKKRSNGVSVNTNSIIRAVPVLRSAAAAGNGTTVTGSDQITGLTSVSLVEVGRRISGTGIAANTKVLTVDTANSSCTISAVATGSATVALTMGDTYYGTYTYMKITGGTFDPNGFTCPSHIISLTYTDDLELDGLTVKHDPANQTWGICAGGRNGIINNCKILNGTLVFQDGIHVNHGIFWRISNNDVEPGDDGIVLGGEVSDVYLTADPDSIRYVTVTNNVIKDSKGFPLKLYVQSGGTGPNWEITDVAVKGHVGSGGSKRNGGIAIIDLNLGVAGTSQIKRVTVADVALKTGSNGHDDTNPYGIWVQSVSHLTLKNIDMEMTDKTAASTGFVLCYIRNSEDVMVDTVRCNALQKRQGVDARLSNRVTIKGCKMRVTAATGQPAIVLEDITEAKVLDNTLLDVKDATSGISITTGTLTNGIIRGNTVKQAAGATTGQALGVVGTAFTHLSVEDNDFNGSVNGANTASLFVLGKCLSKNNRNLADYGALGPRVVQTFATDVDLTLTVGTTGEHALHTGTLTAARAVVLSTTGAVAGNVLRVTRTGTGAFNLNVGTGPLKALVTNTWCEVMYNGAAWVLTAYGAL